MTKAMMKPDAGLADRLRYVRYAVAVCDVGHVKTLADYDTMERSPLQHAAAGELAMSAQVARRLRNDWRATIVSYTAGISDDTLLDDLEAWIERCAKPPFDPATVAEDLIDDIERVTRERLDGLSKAEVKATCDYLGQTGTTVWSDTPFSEAAYDAAMSYRYRG